MARSKRTSTTLETTRQRLAGLKSINPTPDFGASLTVPIVEAQANGFGTRLDTYNQHLAELDTEQNAIDDAEASLQDLNTRILAAVKGQYGADSTEYEAVGGTRTSERKRRAAGGGQPTPPPTT